MSPLETLGNAICPKDRWQHKLTKLMHVPICFIKLNKLKGTFHVPTSGWGMSAVTHVLPCSRRLLRWLQTLEIASGSTMICNLFFNWGPRISFQWSLTFLCYASYKHYIEFPSFCLKRDSIYNKGKWYREKKIPIIMQRISIPT